MHNPERKAFEPEKLDLGILNDNRRSNIDSNILSQLNTNDNTCTFPGMLQLHQPDITIKKRTSADFISKESFGNVSHVAPFKPSIDTIPEQLIEETNAEE